MGGPWIRLNLPWGTCSRIWTWGLCSAECGSSSSASWTCSPCPAGTPYEQENTKLVHFVSLDIKC